MKTAIRRITVEGMRFRKFVKVKKEEKENLALQIEKAKKIVLDQAIVLFEGWEFEPYPLEKGSPYDELMKGCEYLKHLERKRDNGH